MYIVQTLNLRPLIDGAIVCIFLQIYTCGCIAVSVAAMASRVAVVIGGQWGDEGKGKLVDLLSVDADLVCRCNVSQHTIDSVSV